MKTFEPHYKLNLTGTLRVLDAVWEQTDKIPNYVYAPSGNQYSFKHCKAKIEEIIDYRNWSFDKENTLEIWKLECFDNLAAKEEPSHVSDGWRSIQTITIPISNEIIVLSSDAEGVDEILLIEKKFLQSVKPSYVENKFDIPIKHCRIRPKTVTSFSSNQERKYLLCEIHNHEAIEGATTCEAAIPREYLPCEIESDQGGDHCETHGGWAVDYENYCEYYKGPLESYTEMGRVSEQIPENYRLCYFFEDKCSHHEDGAKEPDKTYCDKYDGPLRILR